MNLHVLALAVLSLTVGACSSSIETTSETTAAKPAAVNAEKSTSLEKKDAAPAPPVAANKDAVAKPDANASTPKLPAAADPKPALAKTDKPADSTKPTNPEKKDAPIVDTTKSFYSLQAKTLEGKAADLGQYKGKVVLVVNTASECGYTPQYEGLEKLQKALEPRGFTVLGFPSNDFGKQEPGDATKIREFCTSKFSVTFPLFEKLVTKPGADQSPIYAFLNAATGKLPSWNFCKYLIGKDGKPIAFYASKVTPEDPELAKAIDAALAAK